MEYLTSENIVYVNLICEYVLARARVHSSGKQMRLSLWNGVR